MVNLANPANAAIANAEGVGFIYDDDEGIVPPTVTTSSVTDITQISANCGGNVTSGGGADVTARGVCWSTSQNPTIDDSKTTDGTGTGTFTSSLTGLIPDTTYYVRAYATNSAGTGYGSQKQFHTPPNPVLPTVTTSSVTDITQTSASCGGNVTSDGGADVTARGVCWSTSQNPTIDDSKTTDGTGTGTFSSNLTGLSPDTTYYVRAYATNSAGTGYGSQVEFHTSNGSSHWSFSPGDPSSPVWKLYLISATLDSVPLQAGDEIALFDGEILVGWYQLEGELPGDISPNIAINAFSVLEDGSTGYTPGHEYTFRCWDSDTGTESRNVSVTFPINDSNAYEGDTFPSGDGQYSAVSLVFTNSRKIEVALHNGFQMVSSNVLPPSPDIKVVFQDVLPNLQFVRDSAGNMLQYAFGDWQNGIGNWSITEGYLVRISGQSTLTIVGLPAMPQTPIDLHAGYQFIAYLPDYPLSALEAFADVVDNLAFVRDSNGNMLQFAFGTWQDGIGNMTPGGGYLVRMNAPDQLIYPVENRRRSEEHTYPRTQESRQERNSHWSFNPGDPSSSVWKVYLVSGTMNGANLEVGDEIALFDGTTLVGWYQLDAGLPGSVDPNVKVTAFSVLEDGSTGYTSGHAYTFKCWDSSEQMESSTYMVSFPISDPNAYEGSVFPFGDGQYSAVSLQFSTGPPTITSATLASDNSYVDVSFSTGVYGNAEHNEEVRRSDFMLLFEANERNATVVNIASVRKTDGSVLDGGETTVRVNLTVTGTPVGVETIEIKPADGNAIFDSDGNAMSADQTTGQITLNDKLAPVLNVVTIASNNADTTLAKAGDTVTLNLTASEDIQAPTVTIAGHAVTPTNVSRAANKWQAAYTLTTDDSEGQVPFSIDFQDLAGNAGTPVSTTTDGSSVTFDKTAPTGNLADPADGATVALTTVNGRGYLDVTFADTGGSDLDAASITDAGQEFTLSGAAASGVTVDGAATATGRGTYRYTFTGEFSAGTVTVSFTAGTFADNAGNLNAAATESFTLDAPRITDVTPPGTGSGLGTATVTVTDTISVAENGQQQFTVTPTGGTGTYHYEWKLGGETVGADSATYTYDPAYGAVAHPNTSTDATLVCTVTDTARAAVSATATWQVVRTTDVNRAPNEPTVAVTPTGTVYTDQDLTCTVTPAGDPDDREGYSEPLEYRYVWADDARSEVRDSGWTDATTDVLPSSLTQKDRTYTCTVTVRDDPYGDGSGRLESTPASSNAVPISNSAPTPSDLVSGNAYTTIVKSVNVAGYENQTLDLKTLVADKDGIDDIATFTQVGGDPHMGAWSLNTTTGVCTFTPAATGRDLEDGEYNTSFQFNVTDASGANLASDDITVNLQVRNNQPPEIVSVSPHAAGDVTVPENPDPVDEVDGQGQANSVQFSATFTDDNDPSGNGAMADIKWYVDGVEQRGRAPMSETFTYTTDGYDTVAHPDRTGTVEVKAVGVDNQGGETSVTWTVTINDKDRDAPAPTTVTITPAAPTTGNDLTANIADQAADPDGDEITGYTYLWTKTGGGERGDFDQAALDHAQTKKGETWQVTVRPITDPYGDGDTASANAKSASVTIGNTEPIADAQAVTTDEDTVLAIQLTGTDPDVDDGVDTLTFALAAQSTHGTFPTAHGTLSDFDPATGTVTYTPNPDYNGADSFTFTVTDGDGRGTSAPATVGITVISVNDPPVPVDSTLSVKLQDAGDVYVDVPLSASDKDGTIDHFVIETLPDAARGELRLPDGVTVLNAGDTIQATNNQAVIRFYPAAGNQAAGQAQFTYAAVDNEGLASNDADTPAVPAVGTVTIGIGTPPWFPILSWSNLGIVQPSQGHRTVYRLQILGMIDAGAEIRQTLTRRFLDTWIVDATSLLPVDYDAAGCPGLLPNGAAGAPADHYSWRIRVFVDGARVGSWVDGQDFTVENYGLPGQGQTIASGQGQPPTRDAADELFWFKFDLTNAAKYEIEITNGTGFRYDQVVTMQRRDDGTVEFVGPFTHSGVFLPPVGPFQWRVRGWNPLGWGTWSDAADEPGPDPDGNDYTPTKPIPVGQHETDADGNDYYQMPSVQTNDDGRGIVDLQWTATHATAYQLVVRAVAGRTVFRGMIGDRTSPDWMPNGSYTTNDQYYRHDPVAGLKPGEYVWFVRGMNRNAVAVASRGPWSAPCFFEVLEPAGNETRPGRVQVLKQPVVTDNGDGTGNVTFYFDAQNTETFTVRLFDPNQTPRRFRIYSGIPAGDGVDQTVNGAIAFPMTRPAVYQVWAVDADGVEGPKSSFHVIRPPTP